jgi:hypothetical protein
LNSDKHRSLRQRGNAMIYILLSLALIGALTLVMSRQADQGGDDLSADQAELLATQILAYAASAQTAVDGMMQTGSTAAQINFIRPSEAGFDTPPNIHKLYHPAGGGLSAGPSNSNIFTGTSVTPPPGWYVARYNNVAWTPTSANDVIITAHQISESICKSINKKITGTSTIPQLAGTTLLGNVLLGTSNGASGNENLTATECPGCVGFPSLCIANGPGLAWSFYSIISGQ